MQTPRTLTDDDHARSPFDATTRALTAEVEPQTHVKSSFQGKNCSMSRTNGAPWVPAR